MRRWRGEVGRLGGLHGRGLCGGLWLFVECPFGPPSFFFGWRGRNNFRSIILIFCSIFLIFCGIILIFCSIILIFCSIIYGYFLNFRHLFYSYLSFFIPIHRQQKAQRKS